MSRLYADENFPLPSIEFLREKGHDVLTSLEAGKAGQAIPDDAVLKFASDLERAVITLNRRDFIRLHTEQSRHAGINVCTSDSDFAALAQRIHEAIEGKDRLNGQWIRVNRSAE